MLGTVWQRTGFAGKTLWDWLQLLIVPLVLALAAFALNAAQADRDRAQDARQAAQERLAAEDGAREDTLRGYLQQVSDLITHEGLASRGADREVRTLARTLTLTTLRRLDGERKTLVVRFLLEAGLINQTSVWTKTADGLVPFPTRGPQIPLAGADVRGIVMTGLLPRSSGPNARGRFEMTTASFRAADLRGADFRAMNLVGAEFDEADLRGATSRTPTCGAPRSASRA